MQHTWWLPTPSATDLPAATQRPPLTFQSSRQQRPAQRLQEEGKGKVKAGAVSRGGASPKQLVEPQGSLNPPMPMQACAVPALLTFAAAGKHPPL
eukprot:scaffold57937_cov18-Tisochrysis_lutea.AAC.1